MKLLQLLLIAVVASSAVSAMDESVRFSQDIQPLLAERCFRCHGPDNQAREAGLRLDQRSSALSALESDERAIVPGKPEQSALLARVTEEDEDLRMPPADAGQRLKPEEIQRLRLWIEQGAEYQTHWAFRKPVRPKLTVSSNDTWSRGPIDQLVLKGLRERDWTPAPEAPKTVLIRRVSLALTGLPPDARVFQEFVQDTSPSAYSKLVERLLASPAFGERWGRVWLDLARYADSAGYAQDPPRTIWRYRDWVISSLNRNQPFDQFTIEQLAGDRLDKPSDAQRLATAFHRNTMTNSEGGTDDEEFRNAAVIDRVNTTMQVWMGLTMGCAQCHTHKYDPITQREYFEMFAVFNNTTDADRGNDAPLLTTLSLRMQAKKDRLERQLAAFQVANPAAPQAVSPPSGPLRTKFIRIVLPGKKVFLSLAEVQLMAGGKNVALKGKATQLSTDFEGPAKLAVDGNTDGHYFDARSTTHTAAADDPWWEVELPSEEVLEEVAVFNRTDGGVGSRLHNFQIVGFDAQRKPLWIQSVVKSPQPSVRLKLPTVAKQLKAEELQQLAAYQGAGADPQRVQLKQQISKLQGVTTPVMEELPEGKRRKTHIQIRGNFLDRGDEVQAGVLDAFHPLPEGEAANRLTVARWLVDGENPLTARVTVNRFWEQLFGVGLVATSEDFGLQGDAPSNRQLLDYLAVEFASGGWDIKRLLREIVMSSTYRQSTVVSPNIEEEDRRNRWFARGPRFRLSAEMIRDQALFVSGLLCNDMYGPSVRPPRPKLGLKAAFGGSTDWEPSPGGDRYRRGLYTSWRRTTPYPSMTTFDAPSREVCTIRRVRTNTPLQALVTLNDPVFVEAAQALGRLAIQSADNDDERLQWIFRRCLFREATVEEMKLLHDLLAKMSKKLRENTDPSAVTLLATQPRGPLPSGMDSLQAAIWTVIGNVLLNLDELLSPR